MLRSTESTRAYELFANCRLYFLGIAIFNILHDTHYLILEMSLPSLHLLLGPRVTLPLMCSPSLTFAHNLPKFVLVVLNLFLALSPWFISPFAHYQYPQGPPVWPFIRPRGRAILILLSFWVFVQIWVVVGPSLRLVSLFIRGCAYLPSLCLRCYFVTSRARALNYVRFIFYFFIYFIVSLLSFARAFYFLYFCIYIFILLYCTYFFEFLYLYTVLSWQ